MSIPVQLIQLIQRMMLSLLATQRLMLVAATRWRIVSFWRLDASILHQEITNEERSVARLWQLSLNNFPAEYGSGSHSLQSRRRWTRVINIGCRCVRPLWNWQRCWWQVETWVNHRCVDDSVRTQIKMLASRRWSVWPQWGQGKYWLLTGSQGWVKWSRKHLIATNWPYYALSVPGRRPAPASI